MITLTKEQIEKAAYPISVKQALPWKGKPLTTSRSYMNGLLNQ
jgi:hypothetical protein